MAITLSISSGQVDLGDSKILKVTPKDENGDAFDLAKLVVVFTPPTGSATTYATDGSGDEAIGSPSSSVYSITHAFDVKGTWRLKVTGTDANDNVEVETGFVEVKA